MRRSFHSGIARPRQRAESGQAMVEFALILFPLLILVAGVIQFGIGLNFWLDQQRLANQGARWAVVNSWPGCARTETNPCNVTWPTCTGSTPARVALQDYLRCQAVSRGLQDSVAVTLCYPDDGDAQTNFGDVGTPIRVRLQAPFTFVPIMNIGTIQLRGQATMRLEQRPTHLTGVTNGC
jgi:hypothetical protein